MNDQPDRHGPSSEPEHRRDESSDGMDAPDPFTAPVNPAPFPTPGRADGDLEVTVPPHGPGGPEYADQPYADQPYGGPGFDKATRSYQMGPPPHGQPMGGMGPAAMGSDGMGPGGMGPGGMGGQPVGPGFFGPGTPSTVDGPYAPPPPFAPPPQSGGGGYVVDSFGAPPAPPRPEANDDQGGSAKKWLLTLAAVLVVAVIAASAWFFLLRGDDDSNAAGGEPGTSEPATTTDSPGSVTDSPPAEPSGSTPAEEPSGDLAGTYQVSGTVTAIEGPQDSALGAGKKVGDPTFRTPQTWTITGCTDGADCTLTMDPGATSMPLTASGDTWSGETTVPFVCSIAGQQSTEATLTVEIKADGSGTRMLSAPCSTPFTETSDITLTKQ